MGAAAAAEVAEDLRARLARQPSVRMVFAAAPSQTEVLAALQQERGIEWARVTAFHMDEYTGLPADHPARFGRWLQRHLFDALPLGMVHLITPEPDPEAAASAYTALLAAAPIDLVLLGIGVNGHIAFNDPPVADLADPLDVKMVELDPVCRQQQVDDGCFSGLDVVPRRAITLTVPRLLRADKLVCVVPGSVKRAALRAMLHDPIGEACPATALRTHPRVTVHCDADAAGTLGASC
ncbi:glucosamine-6-phosphate deaminase [Methylobacterium terricola]|uniref:Glucosamine-6-phosphate deaminase n=2 Tax=Methylobacterium terricola TaxID=2583531 RepID=A0A5C4L5K0_9HYPH|nr:glucosamine-6-phosphate deaminase [Methylobacterium terricola]